MTNNLEFLEHFIKTDKIKHPGALLLDSSLITQTQNKYYTFKIIQCGDYIQIYRYDKTRLKIDKNLEKLKNLENKSFIYTDMLIKKENYKKTPELGVIEQKNIERSKFQMQRLVKANEKYFKTFITLTFSDNIKDITSANKVFNIWRTKIKSIFKDFRYIAVPEFQKRGAVHYHLLTNIEINKEYSYIMRNKITKVKLIIPQEGKKSQYDVKYWSYGYSSVFPMNDINVIGYLSKYMTKDVDNRLFGHRRYFYSSNLVKPCEYYVNLNEDKDFYILADIFANNDIKYKNTYYDMFGGLVDFIELKKAGEGSPSEPAVTDKLT